MRFGTTILLVSGFLVVPTFAFADDVAKAKELFDQGVVHMQAHEYELGCKQIAESLQLDRRAGTLYSLATCEYEWGRWATADARYQEFLKLFESLPNQDKPKQEARVADVNEKRAAIAKDIPHWTLTLAPNAPAHTVVRRNGEVLSESALGVETPVDPGFYVITTQAPGGPRTDKKIEVLKGMNSTFVLDVAPALASSTPPRRRAGFILIGAGGALTAAGLVAGAVALSKTDTIAQNCGEGIGLANAPTVCTPEGKAAGESAEVAATIGTVGVISGLVAVAGGVVLLVNSNNPAASNTAHAAPRAIVGLWSTGLSGAMMGLQGTW